MLVKLFSSRILILVLCLLTLFTKANCRLFYSIQDNFFEVDKSNFYRSKQLHHSDLRRYIKKFGIKTVINLRGKNEHRTWWQKEKKVTQECGAKLFDIPMSAKRFPYKKDLEFLLKLYDKAPKPIYVHCHGGSDRTGEAAALWKLIKQKKSKKEALKELSLKYGYIEFRAPKKRLFIKLWPEVLYGQKQFRVA